MKVGVTWDKQSDKMVRWDFHRFDGHEFEQAPAVEDEQET